ncbi:MAG: hypothetical protein JWM47_4147 [Acidimicrobiales bacterium]|nr:hypothetical protein [Acidimicrobiales bacterium]
MRHYRFTAGFLFLLFLSGLALRAASARSEDTVTQGMATADYRRNGWWQDGPPVMSAPAVYPADTLAVSSKACDHFRVGEAAVPAQWEEFRGQCRQSGYETVHLYVSTSRDDADEYADWISREDPWFAKSATRNRVYLIRAKTFEQIQLGISNLLMECKVIQNVIFVGHGVPGFFELTDKGHNESAFITDFIRFKLNPCSLAPGAHIQFASCEQVCGKLGDLVRQSFEKTFNLPDMIPSGNSQPFEGVSLLFNTAHVSVQVPNRFEHFFGIDAYHSSDNGIGIQYRVRDGKVEMDLSADKIPACKSAMLPEELLKYFAI